MFSKLIKCSKIQLKKVQLFFLRHINKDLILREIQGNKMYLDLFDTGISEELFFMGVHEKNATGVVKKLINKDMTVIDIGANLGYYALIEASVVKKVYAIEPIPKNIDLLKKNIELNCFKNVDVFPIAISSKNGAGRIKTMSESNLCMMTNNSFADISEHMKQKLGSAGKVIEVPSLTLDSFIKKQGINQVHFIRMDVEGFETEIIKGMDKTLKNMPMSSKLFIEVHNKLFANPKKALEPMIQKILNSGFKPIYIITRNDILSVKDMGVREFESILFSYSNECPHVFFKKF